MRLDLFSSSSFDRGRSVLVEAAWALIQAVFVSSWLPGSYLRIMLLRVFGARIGHGVVIKPRIHVKFPWRLTVGDHTWIGEDSWIDNLAPVAIGSHCSISQGVYLCTGNHDWSSETFDLITKPITIYNNGWVGAHAIVGPGVVIGEGAVLTLGSVAIHELKPWGIYQGNPAVRVRERSSNTAKAAV